MNDSVDRRIPVKKRHGLHRAIEPMPKVALEAFPTKALLARIKRLRWCEESGDASDLSDAEIASASHLILFKSDAAWKSAYSDVRDLLAEREHVESKP